MDSQVIEKVKHLWETWDIRGFMIASLVIQASLTFLAPLRKFSANTFLRFFIWMLYLSADAIGVFVIGLISSNEDKSSHKKEILAFWAPFVLLHLGGPDTITALALEDNELWNRHALQLATQVTITIYVFVLSFRHTSMLAPTLLMFINGLWKYFERTCALFFASADSFRDSLVGTPEPGPNYARLMEEYFSAKDAHIPTDFESKGGRLVGDTKSEEIDGGDIEDQPKVDEEITNGDADFYKGLENDQKIIIQAHYFYERFKALLADGFLSLKDRNISRGFFVRRKEGISRNEAFRIIKIELNLIYDVFYTKLFLLHRKRALARIFCVFAGITSLVLFSVKDKNKYQNADVVVTFVLLGGAIAMDLFGALIFIMSDWWIIMITLDGRFIRQFKSTMLLILRCSRWARRPNRQRWSNSISKYNFLERCFREPPSFFGYFSSIKRVRDILIGLFYEGRQQADEKLIDFVIDELQEKARLAAKIEVAKEVCSARGNLVLLDDYFLASECLSPWTVEVDYDESLLIWHLATDICYWNTTENEATSTERKVSKALSDYMSYLLLRQQTLVSSVVGMSDTRFEDTCAEAQKFMSYKNIKLSWLAEPWWMVKSYICKKFCRQTTPVSGKSQTAENEFFKQFSEKVLQVKADVQPNIAKGDKSKSVLFDACRLAKQLEKFGEKQWEITSKVWVELLCYAAVRCSPRSHIAQLSKGGELVTLVWLFMAHLGLGERFLQNQGFGWTKLIIQK